MYVRYPNLRGKLCTKQFLKVNAGDDGSICHSVVRCIRFFFPLRTCHVVTSRLKCSARHYYNKICSSAAEEADPLNKGSLIFNTAHHTFFIENTMFPLPSFYTSYRQYTRSVPYCGSNNSVIDNLW